MKQSPEGARRCPNLTLRFSFPGGSPSHDGNHIDSRERNNGSYNHQDDLFFHAGNMRCESPITP